MTKQMGKFDDAFSITGFSKPKTVNKCEILAIIDRSGSMQRIKDDSIGGLNSFIEDQKRVDGDARLTLILFDHEFIKYLDNVDLQTVEPFNNETYVPRGTTALLDAIGKGISTLKERKVKDKVIVAVLTDGRENASKEYRKSDILSMISEQRKDNWEFIFLGVGEESIRDAQSIGFMGIDTMTFEPTSRGIKSGYKKMSGSTVGYRVSS